MANNISNSKRIAKNTILMCIRMMVVMMVTLYTVRIVLNALGEVDYGVYNVVAGVVTLLNGVSTVLSQATQRFYSCSLASDDKIQLRKIFSASINIYALFSVLVLVLGETIGLWFINTQLDIPTDRMFAANCIYQFALISFASSVLASPYSAAMIAHEDIGVFAIVNVADCVVKLLFAYLLSVVSFDRLIFYGAYLMIIPFLELVVYFFWGKDKYEECKYLRCKDRRLYKELLSFSGWSLYASTASVCMFQINTVLVNIFFGPLANAARAVSLQINSAINGFSSSFLMAIRPPMVKSYTSGDFSYLNKMFNLINKFISFSLVMVMIPILLEMNTVLTLWLKNTNEQTILFSRLIVVYALIMVLNNPITFVIQAIGRVKEYHTLVEIFTLLCMPITWLLYMIGQPAESTYWVMIAAAILSHIARIWSMKKYYREMDFKGYLVFMLHVGCLISILMVSSLLIHEYINNEYIRLTLQFSMTIVLTVLYSLMFGLDKSERKIIKQLLKL